jgi:hypothetical protein
MRRSKNYIFIVSVAVSMLLSVQRVSAHCPLCTAGVGAAAVSAKYFGLDASIIGLFIGAFGVSTGLWIGRKLKKQYIKFQLALIVAASFLLTVIPLMNVVDEHFYVPVLWAGSVGSIFNSIYSVDKILFGSILGGLTSLAAFWLHLYLKKIRGSVLIPFQGIVFTLLMLFGVGTVLFFTISG